MLPESDFSEFRTVSEENETLDYEHLIKCPHCGKPIPQDATMCLYCAEPVACAKDSKPGLIKWFIVILAILSLLGFLLR